MKKMRGMVALCVALSVAAGSSALLAQKVDKKQEEKRSKAEQLDIEVLLKAVDTVVAGQAAATGTMVTWESSHFIRSQDGTTYVPFTIQLDRAKLTSSTVAVYVRVDVKGAAAPAPPSKDNKDKNKAAAAIHPWENVYFATVGPEGKLARAFQVKGGDYDVYIAVKDKGTVEKADKNFNPTVAVAKKELSVPDFNKPDLTTSSVILATAIQPVPAGTAVEEDPYVFGPMQIVPSHDGKYKKADTLEVIYWIYGATGDATGKPDVQIENSFNQKTADGEKFFNKTQPQELNAQSLPPNFMANSGPIPGTLQVPLLSFPPGDYRLEIKITDKPSGKTVTQNVNFSVAAS
jgi:hypothetical protein